MKNQIKKADALAKQTKADEVDRIIPAHVQQALRGKTNLSSPLTEGVPYGSTKS